jgi:hypothetical protein
VSDEAVSDEDNDRFNELAALARRKGWTLSITSHGFMLRRGSVSKHFGDLRSVRTLVR